MLRFVSPASLGGRRLAAKTCYSESKLHQHGLSTAVRSQFGFKLESVWNQRFIAVANSPIEPANRLRLSNFLENQKYGGPDRDRTGDLMNAIHARSQLRYWPTFGEKPDLQW